MKILSDFLTEYATPQLKPLGFRKKGLEYRIAADSGDMAFLGFSPMRIDPEAVVFHVQCSLVPEPYWQWLNRQHMVAGIPDAHASGALAAFSVVPPAPAAYAADATGLARTRWAIRAGTRTEVGRVLGEVLVSDVVPRIRHLLVRENLLTAIKSSESPSIRRWAPVPSELVLMVDEYPRDMLEQLLSNVDEGDSFPRQFLQWVEMRNR